MRAIFLAALLVLSTPLAARPPNIILIFCDDLGYGDLGSHGSTRNRTPRLDRLAREGVRFTSFYSSSPVCTPSRASLLTGCYPRRVGMHEDATGHWVLIPRSRRGLDPAELTLAEALRDRGYATACIGKWHLGDQPEHLPTRHGFDLYYGLPYSNDMASARRGDPPLPLVSGERVVEAPVDQTTLTRRYTEKAIEFIETHRERPFFIYLPHTFPHLPLFASPEFHGKSANGRYGDTVEEIDASTGRILEALERLELERDTLVIFTSDNGSNGRNGGSNAPLSGAKGSTMEGGMRVPFLARWPGRIPAGTTCDELASHLDLLPTLCRLAGAKEPVVRIDGVDIASLLLEPESARSPREVLYYYRRRQLQAIRWRQWKYHLPLERTYPAWTGVKRTGRGRPGKLVNLESDLAERHDVSGNHPEILRKMEELRKWAVDTLGNEEKAGREQRPAKTLESSRPLELEDENRDAR